MHIVKFTIIAFSAFFLVFILASVIHSADSKKIVREKISKGALIIDVRTPEEFKEKNYKGSKNIPLDQIPQRISEFGDKKKPIIVYCRSGRRSAEAKKILESKGYTDVTNGGGLTDMPE